MKRLPICLETRQSILTATAWRALGAAMLAILLGASSGCNQIFGLDETEAIRPDAYNCACTCTSSNNSFPPIVLNTSVCLPNGINPNLTSNSVTQQQLDADCSGRVSGNIFGAIEQCVTDQPIACHCTAFPVVSMFIAQECDQPCTGQDLDPSCSNFNPFANPPQKTATNIPNKEPVCLVASADPPTPVPDPLVAGIFGHTSNCSVDGDVTIERDGDSQTHSATGIVNINGSPCPGGGCKVGMSYRLDHINDFSFDSFGGIESVEFQNLFASGASIPNGATLDASGNGTFAANSTQSYGKGRRSNQTAGVETSSDNAAYVGPNGGPIGVQVNWQNHACAVSGALLGQIEGDATNISTDLTGTITNEPPTANAGAPKTVECTSAGGAGIALDASHSTDPEDNIALFVWRRGTRAGLEIGDDAVVHLNQNLGGSKAYFLKVVDTLGQASESSTSVSVVDTTPPVIASVSASPNVLWAPNHKRVPVSVSVSDTDKCDPAPSCKIVQITSNEPIAASDAQITGKFTANLAASRLGSGSGRIYTITVRCTDANNNSSTGTATVSVPHDRRT